MKENKPAVNQKIDLAVVKKGFGVILTVLLFVLLMVAAIFGGVYLGNNEALNVVGSDILSDGDMSAKYDQTTGDEITAEADSRGTGSGYVSVSEMGYFYPSFSTNDSYFTTSHNSVQAQTGYRTLGCYMNDTKHNTKMTAKASSNIRFTGTAGVLASKGLLRVKFYVRVYTTEDNQQVKVAWKFSGGTSAVYNNNDRSPGGSGWNTLTDFHSTDDKWHAKDEVTATTGGGTQYMCIAMGSTCDKGFMQWRAPRAKMGDIYLFLTNLDTTRPTFNVPTYPEYSTWAKGQRSVSFSATDNVGVTSTQYRYKTSTNSYSSWMNGGYFVASPTNSYSVKASDAKGNVGYAVPNVDSTSSTSEQWFTYKDFKIDAGAPKILQVVYVQSNDLNAIVQNNSGGGVPYKGSVYVYIQVADYSNGTDTQDTSGIDKVTYNSEACSIVSNGAKMCGTTNTQTKTSDGAISVSWYRYPNVIGTNQNGDIGATDRVGNSATIVKSTLNYIDTVAPIITVKEIRINDKVVSGNFISWFNSNGLASQNYIEFYVDDMATSGTSTSRDRAAGINYAYTKFTEYNISGGNVQGSYSTASGAISGSISVNSKSTQLNKDSAKTPYLTCISKKSYQSGSSYYWRYVIRIPLLYSSDYSFSVKDLAGNSANATINSSSVYRPKIDQSAPVIQDTTVVYAYKGSASLGNALTGAYLPADKLLFKIFATDIASTGRNDGSGVEKIEIFLCDSAGNKTTDSPIASAANLNYNTPPGAGTQIYVDANNLGGQSYYLNSNYNAQYCIVVTDNVGNTTDMTTGNFMSLNTNADKLKKYKVYIDNIVPTVQVLNGSGTPLTPTGSTYDGKTNTKIYEYNWTQSSKNYQLKTKFGCSGAVLYKYYDDLDNINSNLKTYSAVMTKQQYFTDTFSQTANTAGVHYYSFGIVSNAGSSTKAYGSNADYWIVLKVKIDQTAPTYQLLGFGSDITISPTAADIATIQKTIKAPDDLADGKSLDETSLLQSGQYYGGSFYAFYYIYETDSNKNNVSGLSNANLTSSEGTQVSQAKAVVKVSHNGYSYTQQAAFVYTNASFTILRVRMYYLDDLAKMTKSGTAFKNDAGAYDIKYNENIAYNIEFYDAVGNKNNVVKKGTTDKNLNYNVDPFPITNSSFASAKYTYDGSEYDYNGEWTSSDVHYVLNKQIGISGVVCYYTVYDAIDDGTNFTDLGTTKSGRNSVGDNGGSLTAEFTLSLQSGSRCGYVIFEFEKNKCTLQKNNAVKRGSGMEYKIRQDLTPPQITAIFFSRNDNLTDNASSGDDILAYFTAQYQDGYTFKRITANINVWTYEQYYMYLVVTDSSSVGSGSGVKTVSLRNQDDTQVAAVKQASLSGGDSLYRSSTSNFGYKSKTQKDQFKFNLTDNQGNSTNYIAAVFDKDNNVILPRVDNGEVYVRLKSAEYTAASGEKASYIENDKLSGEIVSSGIDIVLDICYGISGAKLYYIAVPDDYKVAYNQNQWDYPADYVGSEMTSKVELINSSLINKMQVFVAEFNQEQYPPNKDNKITFTIKNNVETKSRYYFFLVSGINEFKDNKVFAYLAAGDVFIDSVPPTIDEIIYVCKDNNQVINTTDYYTNSNVYAYYRVNDGASGIKLVESMVDGTADPVLMTSGVYEGMYRLEMTENRNYKVKVYDNANNAFTEITGYTPHIDKVIPEFTINTRLSDNTTIYNSVLTDGNFTNSPYVNVLLTVGYGDSGCGKIYYKESETSDWKDIKGLLDMDGKAITFVNYPSSHYTQASFKIDTTKEYWFMAENNVMLKYAQNGIIPNTLDNENSGSYMRIAIDTVKPTMDDDDELFVSISQVWHKNSQTLTLSANDNPGGSGIDKIRMSYEKDGIIQPNVLYVYDEASGRYIPENNFKLSEFTTYSIQITDKAGNISDVYTIKPALDISIPVWKEFDDGQLYKLTKKDGSAYEAGNWSEQNIIVTFNPMYSISGAKVQFSVNNGNTWQDCDILLNWSPSAVTSIPDTDAGKYNDGLKSYEIKPLLYSLNYNYMFRILSNANDNLDGTNNDFASEIINVGQIKVDTEKPIFMADSKTVILQNSDNSKTSITVNSMGEELSAVITKWCNKKVVVTIKSSSVLASGAHAEYSFMQSDGQYSMWALKELKKEGGYYTATYEISEDTADADYKFRIVSGSGLISEILIINDIKIDGTTPQFSVVARTSYEGIGMSADKYSQASEAAFNNGASHDLKNYTNAKFIILRLTINTIGVSGVNIKIRRVTKGLEAVFYENIPYTSDSIYRYYYIPESEQLKIILESDSGMQVTRETEIKIDSALPELYIKAIEGEKSTNWDGTLESSWFTDSVIFKFGVGTFNTDNGVIRSDSLPVSGYHIEYKRFNGTWSDWQETTSNDRHLVAGADILKGVIYKFRIVTNSGLYNELGKSLIYNNKIAISADTVRTMMTDNHHDAILKHLSDNDFEYRINLDSNDYIFTVTQRISYKTDAEAEQTSTIGSSYGKYTYQVKIGDEFVDTDRTTFKHGDLVKVMYDSNNGDNYNGDKEYYMHRYTEYYENYTEAPLNVKGGINELDDKGDFTFRFDTFDYIVDAYYNIKLTATYQNTEVYLQTYRNISNAKFKSTARVRFDSLSMNVNITYTNLDTGEQLDKDSFGNIDPKIMSVGGYLITISFDNDVNSQSFTLDNPNTVLLVKYFTLDNVSNKFIVNDEYDWNQIASVYYDSFDQQTFALGKPKKYGDSDFLQAKDFVLAEGKVLSDFGGSYDGQNHLIDCSSINNISGSYGLFGILKGSIANLKVSYDKPVVVENAQNVGLIASEIIGGSINNIFVNASLIINSAKANSNIGGLAGYAENSEIGTVKANTVMLDINYSSEILGNGFGDGMSLGGVIGKAENDTFINNTQAYIGAEIYYIADTSKVNVGILAGQIGSYLTAINKDTVFYNNFYNKDNFFVNDLLLTDCVGTSQIEVDNATGYLYKDYVSEASDAVGGKDVMGETLKNIVLTKLYNDFDFEIEVVDGVKKYNKGIGTAALPISINTAIEIETIDKYVNLYYLVESDIDMSEFVSPIALHKIFAGKIEGNDKVMMNFAKGLTTFAGNKFGLIGNLDGTVQNLIYQDLAIEVNDSLAVGSVEFGLVSGVSGQNADINNIIAIGHIQLSLPNATVNAGGLTGKSNGGVIRNIFNMANIKVNAKDLALGGIAGSIADTVLARYTENGEEQTDAVFSLARLEGNVSGRLEVGAIYGDGMPNEVASAMNKVFAIESNTYANGAKTADDGNNIYTDFGNNAMRSETVSDGNLFMEIFVTRDLYPLKGEVASSDVGTTSDKPFLIKNAEDFRYIDNALYAYYNIAEDIYFTEFETIGDGMSFTGGLNGKTATSGEAETGAVSALHNVTSSLLYNNEGTVSDLSMDVNIEKTVNEDTVFGAVAVKNSGTIRNVIVSGDIELTAARQDYAITVSGFIGIDEGGIIDNGKIQNSISSINIIIRNSNSVFAGGYIGQQKGNTTISFAIGQGAIYVYDSQNVTMGWLIGRKDGTVNIDLEKIKEYVYTLAIVDSDSGIQTIIKTIDENGQPINYYGTTR